MALDWGATLGSQDNYNADLHNPFNQDARFVASGFDLSGIGVWYAGGGTYFWATMISDTGFLSAEHVHPNPGDTVYFFHDFADSTPDESVTIASGQQLGSSDMWLGQLSSAPTSSVKRYPLIQRNEQTNYPSYIDPKIYVAGWHSGSGEVGYNQTRFGLNDITGLDSGEYRFSYDAANGYGNNEAETVTNDSSAPSFVANAYGGLAIAGIHHGSGIDTSVSAHISDLSGLSGVTIVTDLPGDFNRDFKVNISDLAILGANYNQGGGKTYAQGDITGDGYVDSSDLAIFGPKYGHDILAPSDFNKDSHVDYTDALTMAQHWKQTGQTFANGDANGDGTVDEADLAYFNVNIHYIGGPPGGFPSNIHFAGDFNHSGAVDVLDQVILQANYGCLSGCTFEQGDITGNGTVYVDDLGPFYNIHQPTYVLDTNGDGIIGMTEAKLIFDHFGQTTSLGIAYGDFNQDGVVNSSDLSLLIAWYGVGANQSLGQQTVPEPSTFFGMAMGMLEITWMSRAKRQPAVRRRPPARDCRYGLINLPSVAGHSGSSSVHCLCCIRLSILVRYLHAGRSAASIASIC